MKIRGLYVPLPLQQHRALCRAALNDNRPANEILRDLVETFLERRERQPTSSIPKVRKP